MKWPVLAMVVVAAGLVPSLTGCGKKSGKSAKAPDPMMLAPTHAESNTAADLEKLNLALREYVREKRVIPTDLADLVRSGMASNLPVPPPGKKWVILHHPLGYQVVLADE
jgi:predicted small lipoprotein YifL